MCKFLPASPQAVWMYIFVLWVLFALLNSQIATSGPVKLQRFGFSKARTDADVPRRAEWDQKAGATVWGQMKTKSARHSCSYLPPFLGGAWARGWRRDSQMLSERL